jgi:hypothetical protein
VTITRASVTIRGVDRNFDDDLAGFLARYADACAEAGIDPLSLAALAELAEALLTGNGPTPTTLH